MVPHTREHWGAGKVWRDGIAGLSVAGIILPEAVAYAGIAGLPAVAALVAAVTGTAVYALVGRSRFAVVSPTSSSAALLAASLGGLPYDAAGRGALAAATTLVVGLFFLGAALFRLGGFAGFISRPVLRGFAFGLALTIVARQFIRLGAIPATGGAFVSLAWSALPHLGEAHLPSLGLGLGALVLLMAMRRWSGFPASLVVLALGIAFGALAPARQWGIALVGQLDLDVPALALPHDFAIWERIAELAVPVALIVFAESWGTMRGLALRSGDRIVANRELAALGLANALSALLQGMPVGAGFSAGSANAGAGAQSRLAGLAAGLALLMLMLLARPLIACLPEPVLSAVVVVALLHALSPDPLLHLFAIDRDKWVGLVAALGVLTLGVLAGMLVAVALSVAALLYRLSHPSISELGRVGQGHDFVDISRHSDAKRVAGVAIYRPNAPMLFANVESALEEIGEAFRGSGAQALVLSLEESSDLDSTAVEALIEFARSLEVRHCRLILARTHDRVRDLLSLAGVKALALDSTYSVADAVARIVGEP